MIKKLKFIAVGIALYMGYSFADEDNLAIGYQIGGNTLIGASYEWRLSDGLGVHLGGGLLGFGGGVRIHFNDDVLGSFVDINYKDVGFGAMKSVALEIGGTWDLLRGSGPRGSIGLQKILATDDAFKEALVGEDQMPDYTLAIQLGWAWEI